MNKKLYVGNLPFSAEESQLEALFGADGRQVTSVKILNDKQTGRSRGFGFVEMASPEDAQKAIDALNGHEFMGRALLVNEAREQGEGGGGRPSGGFGGKRGGGFAGRRDREGGGGGGFGGGGGGGRRGGFGGGGRGGKFGGGNRDRGDRGGGRPDSE